MVHPRDTREVVAGILRYREDGRDRYLLCQRDRDGDSSWEFAGGKVREDEGYAEAVVREYDEELGLDLDSDWVESVATAEQKYESHVAPGYQIVPVLLDVPERVYERTSSLAPPELVDHRDLAWVQKDELSEFPERGQWKALARIEHGTETDNLSSQGPE